MEIEGFNFSEVRRFKPPGVFFYDTVRYYQQLWFIPA